MKFYTSSLRDISKIGEVIDNFYRDTRDPNAMYYIDEVKVVDDSDNLIGYFKFDNGSDNYLFHPEESYFTEQEDPIEEDPMLQIYQQQLAPSLSQF